MRFASLSFMLNRRNVAWVRLKSEWIDTLQMCIKYYLPYRFICYVVTTNCFVQISIEKDGNSYFSTLEITSVAVEDGGKYKVTAKNELGESNATISLNFDSNVFFYLFFFCLFVSFFLTETFFSSICTFLSS